MTPEKDLAGLLYDLPLQDKLSYIEEVTIGSIPGPTVLVTISHFKCNVLN